MIQKKAQKTRLLIPVFLSILTSNNKEVQRALIKKQRYCLKKCFRDHLISEEKSAGEVGEYWSREKLTKIEKEKLIESQLSFSDNVLLEELGSFAKIYETIYNKKEEPSKSQGRHVVIFFHGFYGCPEDLMFVKAHIFLENPKIEL